MVSDPAWLSHEAHEAVRSIIKDRLPQWPAGPREFQINAWCRTLAGVSQLLVVPTGGGKTALFGPLLIAQELIKRPIPTLRIRKVPKNPMILVVTPLNALGDAQATEMQGLGIRAVSVNADTVNHAWNEKRDLLDEIHCGKWSATIWSPEKLTARSTADILQDSSFRQNLLCIAIDEAHIVNQWGRGFRQAYAQIGLIRKRIGYDVPVIAATATLVEGPERRYVCTNLGLEDGSFYFERQSCERPNVRTVFRELTHTLTGWQFPDILWVIQTRERVIIYCKSIDLLFRVALYLWRSLPPGPDRLEIIRVWNSLTSARYNAHTLALWGRGSTRVIVATVSFGLGINRTDIPTVVNLGIPESLSLDIQQRGRAGRDLESAALGITYVEPSVMKRVAAVLEEDTQKRNGEDCQSSLSNLKTKKTKGRGKLQVDVEDSEMTVEANMMVVLKAHVTGACLCVAINGVYQNPGEKSFTSCISATIDPITQHLTTTFTRRLPCSSCQPFWEADVRPQPFPPPPSFVIPSNPCGHSSKSRVKMSGLPAPATPLTKKMRCITMT
ncbi:P-loop containing nucleoside triphosphate hydrolase protein [Melanogaster broomeanus]|nr:P-loop containing nucleoside triphosphate hydrolase protein [Melanogaster broomeanus]